MAIPNPIIKFTYEDYLNTPDDKRYELLDGELIMPPCTGRKSSKRVRHARMETDSVRG